jgi:hypothetical protein
MGVLMGVRGIAGFWRGKVEGVSRRGVETRTRDFEKV